MMKLSAQNLFLLAAVLLVGIWVGVFSSGYSRRVCESDLHYINPKLGCAPSPVIKKHGYSVLKEKLEHFISSATEKKDVNDVAIYFRDLENGPTLGLNEHANFASASLLKIPYLLTYLKLAEDRP